MDAVARAIAVAWWLVFAGVGQAAPVLDQQHAPPGDFPAFTVANDISQIQTFTVGITGVLTRIDVQVESGPLTFEDMILSVWSTDAEGLPRNKLAAVAVPASAVGSSDPPLFVTFDLSVESVAALEGELLAIVLNSNARNILPFDERYVWSFGGQYDAGTAFTKVGAVLLEHSEDFHFRTFVEPRIQVMIDIKPGSDTNPVNVKSRGKIPVAVLTTDVFDATTVNASSVRFGADGTEAATALAAVEDVDDDGRLDLILHFDTHETGIECGETSATLIGETLAGEAIQGADAIRVMGCK